MHTAALDEVERRGADPVLMAWLRSGVKASCPKIAGSGMDGRGHQGSTPTPEGFTPGLRATHCDKWNAPFMHGSVGSRAKLTNTDLELVVAVAPR